MKLSDLAAEMKAQLAHVDKGYVLRPLFGGLHVALERRGALWRLAIARTTASPSPIEAQTIAKHFGLPADTTWTPARRRQIQKGRRSVFVVNWHVLETTWKQERNPEP